MQDIYSTMTTKPLNVVIVGGSLAGVMHGVMIKRLGHNAHIMEQYPSSFREAQAAGISTGLHTQEFLKKHDHIQDRPHFVTADRWDILASDLSLVEHHAIPFKLTTWKTLYYRLRANFDGLKSEYVPSPPPNLPTDGVAVYDVGKRVVSISHESLVTVVFEDVLSGRSGTMQPDLIIAADGANSTIRKLLLPDLKIPYAGFLTWRGVIPELNVPKETLDLLLNKCINYSTGNGYIVIYLIPGETGSNKPGERHVNVVWYYNCAENSAEYTAIMTDIDGEQHHRTVPFGKVRPSVWQQTCSNQRFPAPIMDLVNIIDTPFVTAISDCLAPTSSFFNGKIFLVGDALALFRPHAAQSTNQCALHCLLLEKLLQQDITIEAYEEEVISFANTTLLRSRAIGSKYL